MSGFWTLDRVAAALAERLREPAPRGPQPLTGISTDTRTVAAGDCFVALRGERYDAHDFLPAALGAGAAAVVVEERGALDGRDLPVFVVDDTLVALGALARYRRDTWGGPVIAIAGSNGKTSTKELLRAALEPALSVHATRGNLNNRVGVPLTLLSLPDQCDVAVVELGTNLPGEIAQLRAIVRPDIALVTCIAEEHLEGFGSLEGVLREEASVFDDVALAIVPATDASLVAEARARAGRVLTAGLDRGDVHPLHWSMTPDGVGSVVWDDIAIVSPLRGMHNLRNLVLALAAAQTLGAPVAASATGLARLVAPPMRTAWERIGRATVINDAYNANPGSARAALELLASVPASQRVAVLGTMRELGARSAEWHDEVARTALGAPIDVVAGIGDFASALERVGARDERVVCAADVDELWPLLAPRLRCDATILLKASRGVRLERILPHLTSWATGAC